VEEPRDGQSSLFYWTIADKASIVDLFLPTSTEMNDGLVKRWSQEECDQWHAQLAQWTLLESTPETIKVQQVRQRFLMLSRVVFAGGYLCRLEFFEMKRGVVEVLVHGVDPNRVLRIVVDQAQIRSSLRFADKVLERPILEAPDLVAAACVLADRITVRPSRRWKAFLEGNGVGPGAVAAVAAASVPGKKKKKKKKKGGKHKDPDADGATAEDAGNSSLVPGTRSSQVHITTSWACSLFSSTATLVPTHLVSPPLSVLYVSLFLPPPLSLSLSIYIYIYI
jgi:hypothetical protein